MNEHAALSLTVSEGPVSGTGIPKKGARAGMPDRLGEKYSITLLDHLHTPSR